MKTSNIDRAFSKMPKMINVPQVPQMNNYFNQNQQPVQMQGGYMNQYGQMQQPQQQYGTMGVGGQMYYQTGAMQYPTQPQQYPQQTQYNTGVSVQQLQQNTINSMNQPILQQQDQSQNFAKEYIKHYVDYWNNYYEQIKNGVDPNRAIDIPDFREQSVSSLNDRFISERKQQISEQFNIENEKLHDSLSKRLSTIEDKPINISKSRQYSAREGYVEKSELEVEEELIREQYRKKQYVPEEEDLIPVNQYFLLEQSIEEEDYDRFVPESKSDPTDKVLEFMLEEERIEKEKQEKIDREIEEKRLEEERKKQQELKEQMEHEQFYEDNPEIYLEHRKKQKKVIFETLKLEMDRIIDKTQKIEDEMFEVERGLNQARRETEHNSLKRKKTEFYLKAKKLQRDIDNIIVNNKEEELEETNFELLKGLHESIVDDQLERMYEKNQNLFLQVSQALQDMVGVKSKQGTFQQYHYYESLQAKAKQEVKQEREQMEKKRKLHENLLPPQKSLRKNVVNFSKDKKGSNSKTGGSPDKRNSKNKSPLHKKAWGQH